MLRVHGVIGVLVRLRGVSQEVERRDGDLARQLRRAASSVVLNLAEGAGSRAGHRRLRYETALGSARETMARQDVAEALLGVRRDEAARAELDRVIGTLVRLVV